MVYKNIAEQNLLKTKKESDFFEKSKPRFKAIELKLSFDFSSYFFNNDTSINVFVIYNFIFWYFNNSL